MAEDDLVSIEVNGERVRCAAGTPLLNAIINANILIETACGGRGTCHLCRLTVLSGADKLPAPTLAEEKGLGSVLLSVGMRLACQIKPVDGLCVQLPRYETSEQRKERLRRARQKKTKS